MEALLPILGAILMFWFLSRLNHSGDDSPRANARNNDAVSSEPNDAQRASALLKDLENSAQGGLSVAGGCRCLTKDGNTSIEKEGYIPYPLQA